MKLSFKIGKNWKRRETIFFLERMELYLSSGLEINKSLEICEQGVSAKQKDAIFRLRSAVESGSLLSKSLYQYAGVSQTLTGLIEQGELSGSLPKSLLSARLLLEKEDELIKKCTSAMAYPVIIGIFAGLLTIGLVRGVMPQIIPMLKSLKVELPIITKVVIALSDILTKYGLYIITGLFIIGVAGILIYRKIRIIRKIIQSTIIHIPIIGRLVHDYYLAVFLHSCGALIESGRPVAESYSNTSASISLLPLRDLLQREVVSVSSGHSLGSVIIGGKIPSYVASLLSAGELSGSLGSSIIRAGSILDRDIEHSLKKLTALIEPIMMAGMGCAVGAIALSIMMPIYDISRVLQK